MSTTNLKPLRTQYAFDLSGVKYKSRSDIFRIERQWNTFERVENFNDVIFQRFELGLRDQTYYRFKDREEANDYRNGQELHILRYPYLPATTFTSISERAMPNVTIIAGPPSDSQIPRGIYYSTTMLASVRTENEANLAVYRYVSTYNSAHVYKYNFVSDEEKMAYHKAELAVRRGQL